MSLHVHLLRLPDDDALAHLKAQLHQDIILTTGTDVPAAAHILVGGRPTDEQLSGPHLRALIIPWSGLPHVTRERMPRFPHIQVHNLHHNAAPVAETALSLLLAAARQIIPFDQSLRRHDWTPRYKPPPTLLLAGRTALVLGYGAIGKRVAQLCQALEMQVWATKSSVREPVQDGAATIYPASMLSALLPKTNALMICLPLTSETEGLIGAEELALLPEMAVVVNVGRGPIVDEAALYEALQHGRLLGAGLDVWYNYPADDEARTQTPPANYPFHELENVVMSPHRGGGSDRTEELRMTHLARLLNTAAAGEPLPNEIRLEKGY